MNKKEICRFFIGKNPIKTDEDNNNCGYDNGNCDNPLIPCSVNYK